MYSNLVPYIKEIDWMILIPLVHVGGIRFQACPLELQVIELGPDRAYPASHVKYALVIARYPLGSSIRGWL